MSVSNVRMLILTVSNATLPLFVRNVKLASIKTQVPAHLAVRAVMLAKQQIIALIAFRAIIQKMWEEILSVPSAPMAV